LGEIASGLVKADMRGADDGWLHLRIGDFFQLIALVGQPRRFGGKQWYFQCPITRREVSVVWKPQGADRFCSRQTWGSKVAYLSQFGSAVDRAHLGKARIQSQLLARADSDEFPPKPNWMRRSTYNRLVRRFNAYEADLNARIAALAHTLNRDPR